jgi:tetratricopeptide (TPR) repeat protein
MGFVRACFALVLLGSIAFADDVKDTDVILQKAQKQNLTVEPKNIEINKEFVELVIDSQSMSSDEKQYWLNALPTLADEQIVRLVKILSEEKQKLQDLDSKYEKEPKEMTLRHAKERIEKIYGLLKSKKNKLGDEDLYIGVRAAEVYMDETQNYDKAIISKAIFIVEYTLQNAYGNTDQKIMLHLDAYGLYGKSKEQNILQKQEYHLTHGLSYLKEYPKDDQEVRKSVSSILEALSYIKLCQKRYDEALKDADEALSSDEPNYHVLIVKAHALVFLGKTAEAKELYDRAVKLGDKQDVQKTIEDDANELQIYGLPSSGIEFMRTIYGG